ncbi:MAG: GerW family sporulation protein [Clostridiales bacterium]|nr:GerW family sporulation protein [Clostridiales bacterium]
MNNLNTSLDVLFSKMDGFVSSKTVIGDAMVLGDITVIPLVDVAFGVGAGASDKEADKNKSETCGGGLGAKITPAAVIVIKNDGIQLVNVKNENSVNKLIDMIPGILDKLNFRSNSKKKKLTPEEAEIFEEQRVSE